MSFLTLLTKLKVVQMNLKHHLQHESKNGGPGTQFYLVPSGYGPGFCFIKYLSILYNIAEYQQQRLKTT